MRSASLTGVSSQHGNICCFQLILCIWRWSVMALKTEHTIRTETNALFCSSLLLLTWYNWIQKIVTRDEPPLRQKWVRKKALMGSGDIQTVGVLLPEYLILVIRHEVCPASAIGMDWSLAAQKVAVTPFSLISISLPLRRIPETVSICHTSSGSDSAPWRLPAAELRHDDAWDIKQTGVCSRRWSCECKPAWRVNGRQ